MSGKESLKNSLEAKRTVQPRFGRIDLGLDLVADGIARATKWLLGQQHAEGYWCGELEADSMLESDYIFLHSLLGTGDRGKMERAVNEIVRHQNADGGWSIYPNAPSNISLGVKAYFALKLMGWSPDHPVLTKARGWILANGGVTEVNTFTKIYLCFLGQYEYDAVPAVPPEIVLFPNWCYFNIYEISAWSRAILVPLSIAYAKKPFKKIPPEQGIDELFVGGREHADLHLRWDRKHLIGWRNFFLALDRLAHWAERVHIRPLRKVAIRKAEKWLLERFEKSDGLGAIYPAMMNALIALRCLGYSVDDPQFIRAMDEFEKLGIEQEAVPGHREACFRMQPCMSPVWDTAYAVFALGEAGVDRSDSRLLKAADWMLSKEVRHKGDWSIKVPNVSPGGWYFEFNNEFYPDVDDSGQVLLALNCVSNPRERYQHEVSERAIEWIFAMQCRNGGWASFDKDNTKRIFEFIPFADHNAMIDPPTVDITGRILEMLSRYGYTRRDPRVEKAVQFLLREQMPDGSWFGRWGVNYLYGTFLVLRGLEAMGYWSHEPAIQQAAEWIRMVQNADGGWGETCGSYEEQPPTDNAPSTASQTSWAVLGLLAAGDTRSDSVAKGIRWLVGRQEADGSWTEQAEGRDCELVYTGTGFPRVFYLGYHMYRFYFPLLALTTYKRAMDREAGMTAEAKHRDKGNGSGRPGLMSTLVVTILLVSAPLRGQSVHVQIDRAAAFDSYQTYFWSSDAEDSQDGRTLRDAMDRNLASLGWRMVPRGGDVSVTAAVAVDAKQHRVSQGFVPDYAVNSATHYAEGYPSTPAVFNKKETLAITFLDARSGSPVLRAEARWQSSRAANDPRRDLEDKKLENLVARAFKQYLKERRRLPSKV